ncbi:flagellar motor switch protein FliM [Sphingomonas sp. BK345]|uniref:flagellar motor switch protein FliM n=1 Tax=Sphingomonas sp. BK345 TaxID=2586980 RepID=UPI001615988D|nr:FliM/FliN family flagellar motor switch protein [Sphingomonas sp. BK345]MBB3472502.1 flagellar motor switch protein FliM [Sphingomonas sp. BK345]
MVNEPDLSDFGLEPDATERRGRGRTDSPVGVTNLGAGSGAAGKLHPFGDLHTLQHLSARAARGVRQVFEGYWRSETRTWAEPLEVLRLADYRAARGDKLTAYLPLTMDGRPLLVVLDSQFVAELLDLFFGGTGDVSPMLALEFTPAADVLAQRVAAAMARTLQSAWEPLARARFGAERCELGSNLIQGIEGDDVVISTRFGLARGSAKPLFVDVLYPVATLKPHTVALTGKVVAKPAEVDAEWRTQLTRAAMGVRLPVRSVLAEPTISLAKLMDLKEGDVIPISFGPDVPIVIGGVALGMGTVGTSNGRAAIRISKLEGPLL